VKLERISPAPII